MVLTGFERGDERRKALRDEVETGVATGERKASRATGRAAEDIIVVCLIWVGYLRS